MYTIHLLQANTQIDNAKYLNIMMPIYSLIEYGDNYQKRSEAVYSFGEMSQMLL